MCSTPKENIFVFFCSAWCLKLRNAEAIPQHNPSPFATINGQSMILKPQGYATNHYLPIFADSCTRSHSYRSLFKATPFVRDRYKGNRAHAIFALIFTLIHALRYKHSHVPASGLRLWPVSIMTRMPIYYCFRRPCSIQHIIWFLHKSKTMVAFIPTQLFNIVIINQ